MKKSDIKYLIIFMMIPIIMGDIPQYRKKDLVVFGISGRGKSTFLNHLLLGSKGYLFKTSTGGDSCTQDVTKVAHNIFGTQVGVNIYDTPGSFAADMTLSAWFQKMKNGIPHSFDALIWVINIKERALTSDVILFNALQLIFDNFNFSNIILVFSHCDTLTSEDSTPQEVAEKWIANLNNALADKSITSKIKADHIVYFGLEERNKYKPNYHQEFLTAMNALPSGSSKMQMMHEINPKVMARTILEKTDPALWDAVEGEIKRMKTCYDEKTLVHRWNQTDEQIYSVPMKEVKAGDRLLTLTRQPSGDFKCELEPAIIVNYYQEADANAYTQFIKIRTEDNNELKIHAQHYVHVLRNGTYLFILAGSVQVNDSLYSFDINPADWESVDDKHLTKLVKVVSVKSCQKEDIGVPMNIRTPSLNLITNNLWGSSRFDGDAGALGHAFACLAARIHPQGGQMIQDLAFSLKLDKLLSF